MLHSAKALRGVKVIAIDGDIGAIDDVYFDDANWAIRYFVADTGGWLSGRKVLLSPASLRHLYWQERAMHVELTRQQVRNSPDIDTAKPVSRQHETAFYDYYAYPYYWAGPYLWGYTDLPGRDAQPFEETEWEQEKRRMEQELKNADPHLRSVREVTGYAIEATDRKLGHLNDMLFDDEDWSISMLVIDPRNWWPGKDVLVSPRHIERIDWLNKSVVVDLTRDEIKHSPKYDARNSSQSGLSGY